MNFLRATWSHLCLFTYRVRPEPAEELLVPLLPPGISLELVEGDAMVSLVAFDFRHTRVLGVPWPGFINFPEINLRFYVRLGDTRGVMFVRELVPSRLVAGIARFLYHEPYAACPMTSSVHRDADLIEVTHAFRWQGASQTITLRARDTPHHVDEDTLTYQLKEHTWGWGRDPRGRRTEYRVDHPPWRVFPIVDWSLAVDFGLVYGQGWDFLSHTKPMSVVLAEGSPITVSPRLA